MEEKGSVLIVDDNVSLCRTLSFVLRRKGYDSTTASSGMEVIEKVGEMSFDMILMDIKMPVMDGVETFKKIKKSRPETAVRALYLSQKLAHLLGGEIKAESEFGKGSTFTLIVPMKYQKEISK